MNELNTMKALLQTHNGRGNTLPTKALEGKKLPSEVTPTGTAPAPLHTATNLVEPSQQQQHLEHAVDTMNHFVQNVKRDLQFSVDQDLNQTVIKVVDSNTGKLIRQIPDDIFLELARKVKETGQMNLLHATG